MTRKALLPVSIVLVGVVGAVLLMRFRPEPPRAAPEEIVPVVEVLPVEPVTHVYTIEAQGTVQPRTESSLVAEVAGRVLSVDEDFEEGGFFERGQVLVVIDDRDHRAAVAAAEAEVATARLAVAREEEEARVAREEWERFGREGEPTSLVLREPQLIQAQATLASAEARLERARRDLERTRIRAPFAGRVRAKRIDVGDYVAPGTATASIYAVDYAEVRLPLPDDELAYLDLPLGMRIGPGEQEKKPPVVLRGEFAGRTHEWSGYVDRTGGEIDSRTRMLQVVVRVADPYGSGASPDGTPLSVGMFVTATIRGRSVDGAYVVPRSALVDRSRIAVVNSGDRLELRQVQVLRTSRDEAVIGEGLASGELVVTSRLEFMVEGMKVRPEPGEAAR